MKNDGVKKKFSKLSIKEKQIKVKKKKETNSTNIRPNIKTNKINEQSIQRTSFNTNTNFYALFDFIQNNSENNNVYNTLIQTKKLNLSIKNKNKINALDKINYKIFPKKRNENVCGIENNKKEIILKNKSKENDSDYLSKEAKKKNHALINNKINKNKLNKDDKIILLMGKTNNIYEKFKQLIVASSLDDDIEDIKNHKKIKSNQPISKNNNILKTFEQNKKTINSSPINVKEIPKISKKILPIKKNNSAINSKNENNNNKTNSNSYYSCFNFYQKANKTNSRINRNNYNYNKMLNTINNFEFHNYSNIYKIEENPSEINKIKNKNYILFAKKNIDLNQDKINFNSNPKNIIENSDYKSYTKNKIYNIKNNIEKDNININRQQILDKIIKRDKNKFIEYKKKIIKNFCKSIEDYIFLSVKKNFNYFIENLKQFSIVNNSHQLLLKRLQNKTIQKNYFKEREKATFYLSQYDNNLKNSTKIKMNNSNIINLKRKEEKNKKDLFFGYFGKKAILHLNKSQSPSLTEYYDKNNKYLEALSYSNNITNKENLSYVNTNNNNQGNKFNNNNHDQYYSIRSNNIINLDFDKEDRKSETNFQKNNNNNLYIPKRFKLINNYNNRTIKSDDIPEIWNTNNSYILSPFANYSLSDYIMLKKSYKNQRFNQSDELDNDPIRTKIRIKKYGSNAELENNYVNNDNDVNILNNTNDEIMKKNNRMILEKTFDTNIKERNSIYTKKININNNAKMFNKPKTTKIRNQILDINVQLNDNICRSIGKYLSPNIKKNVNQNLLSNPDMKLMGKQDFISRDVYNHSDLRMSQTDPRRELNLNPYKKSGNIKELTVNLKQNCNNNSLYKNDNNIMIYSKNDFDNCLMKEYEYKSKNNNYNENYKKTLLKEENERNDANVIIEKIIKDVSSSDGRLNVFIKYIEMTNLNHFKKKKSNINSYSTLEYSLIDSFSIPSIYQRKMLTDIYYKNYCYGNRLNNQKIKFNKILSSILEEEEKSKAAGSVNNSLASDEDLNDNNNYSHFFIKSLKYFSNLLQNIFDEKKKDFYHKFFRILKKIKNEAFLQGLLNEKKTQTFNQSKNEEKNEEKENKNINIKFENIK